MAVAGVDTWSLCWYLRPESSAARAAEALATVPSSRFRLFADEVDGYRVLYSAGARLLAVEGHPGGSERLAPLTELPAAAERIASALRDHGVSVPPYDFRPSGSVHRTPRGRGDSGFGGVRRLDLTVDIEQHRSVGVPILNCVAAVEPERLLRSRVDRAKRGRAIETVSWVGGAGMVARIYDKGIEQGRGDRRRGELIRFEDQRRFAKGHRPSVEAVVEGYGELLFRNRFRVLRHATKGVTVTDLDGVVSRIEELVETGELTPAEAKKLVGAMVFDAAGVELGSRTTRWRQRDQLRRRGLMIADGLLEPGEEIDLSDALDEVVEIDFDAA